VEAACDLRDVATRPDPDDEDPKPEDRPADEGGFEPAHPEGARDAEEPVLPAGDDPDGEGFSLCHFPQRSRKINGGRNYPTCLIAPIHS